MSLPEYIKNKKPVRVRNFPRTQTRKPSSGPPKPKTPTQKRKPSSGPPKPRRLKPNFNSPRFDIAKKKKKNKNA